MSQEFSTLTTIRNESKQTQQILNLERFGLLPENVQNTVNEAREEGNFPAPMEPISKQEFDEFKKVFSIFVSPDPVQSAKGNQFNDVDFAKAFAAQEKAIALLSDKEIQKEIGAIAGGIIAPTLVPIIGQASLPARISALATQYPRIAKMLAAFVGGTGGSAPFADNYIEALGYGAREMAGEGVYQLFSRIFGQRIMKLFRGRNGENLEEGAQAALKIAMEGGSVLTPARLSSSKTIDMLENFAEVSFLGGGRIIKAGEEGQQAVQNQLIKHLNKTYFANANKSLVDAESKFITEFIKNANKENIDDVLKVFILGGRDIYKTAIDGAYGAVQKQVAKTVGGRAKIIDISKLKKVLKRQMNLQYGTNVVPKEGPIRNIINYINDLEDKVDFNTAKTIRSYLLGKTGAYQLGGTTADAQSRAIAGALQNTVTQQMANSIKLLERSGQYASGEIKLIKQLYENANDLYKNGKNTFNHKFITGLLADDTGELSKEGVDVSKFIYKSLFDSGNPKRVKSFFNLLDQGVKGVKGADGKITQVITQEAADQIKSKIRGQFIFDIIRPNIDATTDMINAKQVLGILKGYKGKQAKVLDEMFSDTVGKNALNNLKTYLRSLSLAQSRGIGRQQGGLALFSGQFAALGGLGGGAVGFAFSGGDVGAGALGASVVPLAILVNNLMNMQMSKSGSNLYIRSLTRLINDGITAGFFDIGQAEQVVKNNDAFVDLNNLDETFPWLKDLDKNDEPNENYTDPDIKKLENFQNDIKEDSESITVDDEPESLINVNLDDTTTLPEISVPEPDSSIMADVISTPISALPSTGTTPGPVGSGMNPQTQQRLESVGLPLFAAHGGIASLMNRKKPKQMVV
jgi:hypothetical protein